MTASRNQKGLNQGRQDFTDKERDLQRKGAKTLRRKKKAPLRPCDYATLR